uniref:Uncharacterized protein n=1 Tax=Meloidogyne javanica TaxID=6303 RepID=A0A915N4V3_MELJA
MREKIRENKAIETADLMQEDMSQHIEQLRMIASSSYHPMLDGNVYRGIPASGEQYGHDPNRFNLISDTIESMIDEQTEQMNSESLFLIFANIYYKEIYDKISEIIEDLNENSDDRKFLESVINESKNEKGSSYIKMKISENNEVNYKEEFEKNKGAIYRNYFEWVFGRSKSLRAIFGKYKEKEMLKLKARLVTLLGEDNLLKLEEAQPFALQISRLFYFKFPLRKLQKPRIILQLGELELEYDFTDLFMFDMNKCEDTNEQNVALLEQRLYLEGFHQESANEPKIKKFLKFPGMKSKMEILVPNFKLKYFIENDPFLNDNQLREHFWEAILSDDKTINLRGILGLKIFVTVRWIDGEIKKLEEEHPQNPRIERLSLNFKKKKAIIGSRYDKIFVMDFNEIEGKQDKIIEKLEKEIRETISEIKKLKKSLGHKFEDIEESMKDFSKWIQDLIFDELNKQLELKEAWEGKMKFDVMVDNKDRKGFAIELRDGLKNKAAKDRLVELIGRGYKEYEIIVNKFDTGYIEPVKFDTMGDKKDIKDEEIVEQTEVDKEALEEARRLEKLKEDKNSEISLNDIINEEKEKYYMENEAKNIFLGEESSSRNIVIDHNKLAIKLELNSWFDDYYERSNKKETCELLITNLVNIEVLKDYSTIEGIILCENDSKTDDSRKEFVENKFLGNKLCNEKRRGECNDSSIYCQICQNPSVKNLSKSLHLSISINFRIENLNIYLRFVVMPKVTGNMKGIMGRRLNIIDKVIEKFPVALSLENEPIGTKMVYELSENSIYGGIYGFLNDKALIVLAHDLLKNQENVHICQILKNFHKKFIENWVDINLGDKKENEWDDLKEKEWRKFEFGKEIEVEKFWKIIPPGYPTQNSLLTLNESTAKIIVKQAKKGLEKLSEVINKVNEETSLEVIKQKWIDWFGNEKEFVEEDWRCTYWIIGIEVKKSMGEKETSLNLEELNSKIKTMMTKLSGMYKNAVSSLNIHIQKDLNLGVKYTEKENLKKWCEENLEAENKC